MRQIEAPRTGSSPTGIRSIDGSRAEVAAAPVNPYRVTFGCSFDAPAATSDGRVDGVSRED